MTDDIVVRLRQYQPVKCWTCSEWGCYDDDGKHHWEEERCVCDCHECPVADAADELERLREANNRWKHVAALFGEAFAIDEYGQYVPSDGSDVFRAVLAYEQAKREEARRD